MMMSVTRLSQSDCGNEIKVSSFSSAMKCRFKVVDLPR